MAHFTMGTGGRYITMLTADWSISTSHDPLPSSCHSEKMLWNPSIQSIEIPAVTEGAGREQDVKYGRNNTNSAKPWARSRSLCLVSREIFSDGRYRYQSIDTSDSSVSFVGIDNSMPYCCKTIRYVVCHVPSTRGADTAVMSIVGASLSEPHIDELLWNLSIYIIYIISYSALYPRQQPWFKSDNPLW